MDSRSQSVAAGSDLLGGWSFDPKAAEISHSAAPVVDEVATVAAVAAQEPTYPWSSGLARLLAMPRPERRTEEYWDELTGEARVISRLWGERALAAGWSPLDLFGCNPDPYAGRVDRNGLVVTLTNFAVGLRLVDVQPAYALLIGPNAEKLRYRTGVREGQVYLWDAYAMTSGP